MRNVNCFCLHERKKNHDFSFILFVYKLFDKCADEFLFSNATCVPSMSHVEASFDNANASTLFFRKLIGKILGCRLLFSFFLSFSFLRLYLNIICSVLVVFLRDKCSSSKNCSQTTAILLSNIITFFLDLRIFKNV